jgi:hypothetical protein
MDLFANEVPSIYQEVFWVHGKACDFTPYLFGSFLPVWIRIGPGWHGHG